MKSVAIIGAGPGGLVAAKVLLRLYPHKFNVTVFEKQERVGGLWAVDTATSNKMLDPQMPTNLSKYTVSFSDLSWSSVDLSTYGSQAGGNSLNSTVPMFPKAWQVGRYLETYWRNYIPEGVVQFNRNVQHLLMLDQGEEMKWIVRWIETDSKPSRTNEHAFDYVVIASGFCSSPLLPQPWRDVDSEHSATRKPKTKHSSKVRSLSDLTSSDWDGSGDILVIGGTMSGVESAAYLAKQISNRRHAPGMKSFGKPRVIHITPRPFYISPQYIPSNSSSDDTTFLPLDLCLYDLTRRPKNATKAFIGRVPHEKAKLTHEFLRSKVGGDQADLKAPSLVSSSLDDAPYIAINTGASYAEFVRAGQIVPMVGRVDNLIYSREIDDFDQESPAMSATVSHKGSSARLDNIVGAVHATGYTPHPGLEFISEDIKRKLEYDARSHRLPFILTDSQTSNENLPGLAFVGLHEGSYWGVEECQARMIATKWATEPPNPPTPEAKGDELEQERAKLRDLRRAMNDKKTDVPQLWNGDYVGLMEQSAASNYTRRDDDSWNGRHGPVFPARYTDDSCNIEEAKNIVRDLQNTLERAKAEDIFVTSAAFFAMQGSWMIRRELKSAIPTSPSGTFVGIASFEPRDVTDPEFDAEYLYIESGDFITDQGFTLKASRRYVYRYNANKDRITSWFVKEDGRTVAYLFLDLSMEVKPGRAFKSDKIFTGHHPCDPDTYEAKHIFGFRGVVLDKFVIQYEVRGPHKDYVSRAHYER